MSEQDVRYWNKPTLKLYFQSSSDCSVDEYGAKAYSKIATVSGNDVFDLQKDLIATGYLTGKADGYYGAKTKRAVMRLQRRAKESRYRVNKSSAPADVATITYSGLVTGVCDAKTAAEIRLWISKNVMAPVGRFKLINIPGGYLRPDVAQIWKKVITDVSAAGGIISDTYGDTTRSPSFQKKTGGNSLYSLHYTGRAIDLFQDHATVNKNQRYFVVKEIVSHDVFWRIYCKTNRQDGTQGTKIVKKDKLKHYSFYNHAEYDIPEGYYIDLTKIADSHGFKRIKAHSNWKTNAKGTEWWHFHYDANIASTIQDELELLGYSETKLKALGWTNAKLDHAPG